MPNSDTASPGPSIEEVRRQIQRTLARYLRLEEQLQQLERDRFRVCIFGSARIRPEDPTYHRVYEMARLLAELGIDIVTGGGPGLMEAANRAVRDIASDRSRSIGLPIDLPRARELANKHLDIKSEHKRFSTRLDEFMSLSHAVVVAPGGIGTLLELMYVWQLIQVGMVEPRPVVLLDRKIWSGLLQWMRDEQLARGFIGAGDFDWIHCVDTPEEVLACIRPELEAFRAREERKPEGAAVAAQASRMLEELDQRKAEPAAPPEPGSR